MTSEALRKQGNARYKSAQIEGLNATLKQDRLSDALRLYHRAYSTANSSENLASAAKNIGTASQKLAVVHYGLTQYVKAHFFHKEALSYLSRALWHGFIPKQQAWKDNIMETLQMFIEEACENLGHLPYRKRLGQLEQYTYCLNDDTLKASVFLRMGEDLFKEAITNLTNTGYRTAIHDLRECYRPINEARRLARVEGCALCAHIKSEVKVLEEDCRLHSCIAESIQARLIGDDLLQKQLADEENINMSMILDIVDWYRKAILQTREYDLEQEAIALSRLGNVFEKVMKKPGKAHDSYQRAVHLALSMHPRTFNAEAWFMDATAGVKRFQDEVVKQEDKEWAKTREKYTKKLEKELKALQTSFDNGDTQYIKYVYKKHPPKKADHKLGDMKKNSMKSLFKKALIHYHPDRQKEHGDKWVVLCEEICKLLTQRYECYKGD